ncbi:MAG: winged helix-turn-helix domain-containing protein [Candidatus Eisenbacteria bacterium]
MNDANQLPGSTCDVHPFRIGTWLVQPGLNRLTRGQESIAIEPRIMHVLTCLASRPGQVVARSALLDTVWGEVVVNEEALTHAVSQLRRVLGDDPKNPGFIETIHKSGYRLIAPVSPDRGDQTPGAEAEDTPGTLDASSDRVVRPQRGLFRKRLVAALGTLIVVIAVISVFVIIPRSRSKINPLPVALEEIPLTSYTGSEICPAISPDGTRIAFSWKQEDESNYDLYITQKNAETPLRLTDTDGDEYYAVWSPDGAELAYAYQGGDGITIYIIPAIGGSPRKVVDPPHGIAAMDWSPDGRSLAYSSRKAMYEPHRIFLFSFETGQNRELTSPVPFSQGDYRPVFSPDGASVAFTRGDRTYLQDIFIVPTRGGDPERITHSQHYIAGLDWTPDGEALIFSSGPTRIADLRLWRLSLKDRSLTWLPTVGHRPLRPSVALKAAGLVYEQQSMGSDILKIEVPGDGKEAVPVIASTRHDYGPQYSPGGNLISFISTRSGSPQIWVCRADGSNPRELTRFERAYIENPCWSYDERRIAFSAAPGNQTAIYVADIETGEVTRLSASDKHEKCLGWSRDGEWLYCKSERSEAWWVWKIRSDGSDAVDLMEEDVFRLAESSDGRRLVYSRADTSGVWSTTLAGTEKACLINEPGTVVPCGWRETEKGIYFFNVDEGAVSLWLKDAATGEVERLATGAEFFAINLDVSPAGDAVVFDRMGPIESDIALVEAF